MKIGNQDGKSEPASKATVWGFIPVQSDNQKALCGIPCEVNTRLKYNPSTC